MLQTVSLRLAGYLALGVAALALGCSGQTGSSDVFDNPTGDGTSGSSTGGSGSSSAGSATVGGSTTATAGSTGSGEFPCEVQQLLATKCQVCHKVTPPGTLLTSADFKRPSVADPTKTVGQLAVERLQATGALRMPPAPLEAATAAEIAALSTWVQAGAMPTSCGQTPVAMAPNPYDTPVVCSSKTNWTGGNRESANMRPGGACISCHSKGEGPCFSVAGTVYPTPHEPDDCNGISSSAGAQVVITEANGTVHTLSVNSAGNFYLESRTFAYPYQAKVVSQGKERVMVEAQKSGDCNACHTEAGTQNAPGRIFPP